MSTTIEGQSVLLSAHLALADDQKKVQFTAENGLVFDIHFIDREGSPPSATPTSRGGGFKWVLENFGSSLGMGVGGTMGYSRDGREMWAAWTIVVYTVGAYKTVLFTVTDRPKP